jgi:indolepyruvate ferredoxin oxidoreductase beta subunit
MPFTVALGKGVYPDVKESLILIKGKVKRLIALNASALAEQAGSPMAVNIVMLGALAQSQTLSLTVAQMKEALRMNIKKKLLETNLKAFDLGFEAAAKL